MAEKRKRGSKTRTSKASSPTPLQQKRGLISAIFETIGALVVVLDREGRIIAFNRACEEATGYESSEVEGQRLWDTLVLPEEAREVRAVFNELRTGQFPNSHANFWRTKSGEHRFIIWRNTAVLDDDGEVTYVIGTGIDITEQRKSAEALRQSEQRHRQLFEESPLSIWEEDFSDIKMHIDELHASGVRNLGLHLDKHPGDVARFAGMVKIIGVNKATLDFYGAKDDHEFRQGLAKYFVDGSYEVFREELIWLDQGREGPFRSEIPTRTLAGEERLVDLRVSVARGYEDTWSRILVTFVDITARQRAEENLRKALSRVRRSSEETAALLEGTSSVLAYERFEDAARVIFDVCKHLIGARAGYVALLKEDGAENELLFLDSGGIPCTVDPKLPMPIRGLRQEAYKTGKPVYENDFHRSKWKRYMPKGHARLDNVLFAPLVIEGKAQGLLGLANKQDDFTDDDATLAAAFAENAAIALQNARLLESLKIGEERFRSIAESAADAIIIVDSEGKIVFWNPAAGAIFGHRADEELGKSLEDLMPRRFRKSHRDAIKRITRTGKKKIIGKTIELAGLRRDGREFPLELSLSEWKTAQGTFFTGMIRDITRRKEAEKALRDSSEKVQTILDALPAGVSILDAERRLSFVNPGLERILDMPADSMLRGEHSSRRYVRPDGTPMPPEEFPSTRAAVAGAPVQGEVGVVKEDGTVIWTNVSAAPVPYPEWSVVIATSDITDRKRAEILGDALNSINATVGSTLQTDEIMQRVVVEAGDAIGAETTRISLRDGTGWVVRYGHGAWAEPMIGKRYTDEDLPVAVLASEMKQPIAIEDAYHDDRVHQKTIREDKTRSLLVLPLIVRGYTIGVLSFRYHSRRVSFSPAQIDFASKLASSVSLALQNARLYEQEHRIATILQQHLIQPLPEVEGLDVGIVYGSAYEAELVGGDLYDIFEVGASQVAVFVGDVSGKGIRAAGLTETIRSAVRTLAYVDPSPAFVFNRLNQSLIRQLPENYFATGVLLVIDTSTRDMRISTAGHPPPVIYGNECSVARVAPGPLLGVFPATYRESYVHLEADQTIILYTDGLIEARHGKRLFGQQRLLTACRRSESQDPQAMTDHLLEEAKEFARGRLTDDIAIVALRPSKP